MRLLGKNFPKELNVLSWRESTAFCESRWEEDDRDNADVDEDDEDEDDEEVDKAIKNERKEELKNW